MTNERNHFKAGLFILISIGLIVTVILSIKGIKRIFTPEQERTVSFLLSDDLGGLQVGDEVRLGGFKVGVVKDIELREDATAAPAQNRPTSAPSTQPASSAARLIVTFSMPRDYELREGAVIAVQSGITGTACLNISEIGTGPVAPREVALVGKPSALNALLANLGDVSPEIKPMVADAKLAVADVRTRVVPNLSETLTHFKGAGAHLEDVLGDTKGDIRGTMANLKDSTATVKEKLPATMDNANKAMESANKLIARIDDTVKNTEGILTDVKESMANFKSVSVTAREVITGNKGKIDTMIASLKTTGDNLKAASVEIRHSPWRLLYKPGKGEMANLNLYDSARQFADGAGSLNDAALALRDALGNEKTKPEEVKQLLRKLDDSFANFKQVEDKLWASVQE